MGSNDWRRCSNGIICNNRSNHPRFMVNDVLVIAASMIGGFIFAALLSDGDVDDDDHFDGGMMIPASVPAP